MPVSRLIYFSENQIDPGLGSVVRVLASILSVSNKNNQFHNITGALVFDDQWFIQVLEGERSAVWKTFERIRDDERHSNIVLAEVADVDTLVFGNWWMGVAARTAQTEHAFAPFLLNGRLDPRHMSGAQMLSLAKGVARLGLRRELSKESSNY